MVELVVAQTATIPTMKTANKLIPQGRGLAAPLLKRAQSVALDWDTRQKSRFECKAEGVDAVGVFLPRGTVVRGGDLLVCEDGSLVKVVAAPQAVLRITACASHGNAFDLMRAAYHLGNRHVAIELQPSHLQIEPDHVLAGMLRAMHLDVEAVDAPFEPEAGAYAAGHGHAHEHGHGHGHEHAHAHTGGHSHEHEHLNSQTAKPTAKSIPIAVAAASATAPHVHGPHCNHGHARSHGNGHAGHEHHQH